MSGRWTRLAWPRLSSLPMGSTRATLHHLSIPLKGRFHTATGDIGARDISILEVDVDGIVGWGEASPYPGLDEPINNVLGAAGSGATTPTLASAIECAIADARARIDAVSLASVLGSTRTSVPASIAVGLGGDPRATVDAAALVGVTRFKVKIAPGHVVHVADIVEAQPHAIIGLDANGSFDVTTIDELESISELGIVYLEQPCHPRDTESLERLHQIIDVPVFADDTVRSVSDANDALASPWIDGVVIKPGRLGLAASLAAIGEAEHRRKRWRASGLLETGIGRSFSDLFAARPTAFVSDVAPADWFLEHDLVPSRFADGQVQTPDGHGIGVDPDPDMLDRYRIASVDATDSVTRWVDANPSS